MRFGATMHGHGMVPTAHRPPASCAPAAARCRRCGFWCVRISLPCVFGPLELSAGGHRSCPGNSSWFHSPLSLPFLHSSSNHHSSCRHRPCSSAWLPTTPGPYSSTFCTGPRRPSALLPPFFVQSQIVYLGGDDGVLGLLPPGDTLCSIDRGCDRPPNSLLSTAHSSYSYHPAQPPSCTHATHLGAFVRLPTPAVLCVFPQDWKHPSRSLSHTKKKGRTTQSTTYDPDSAL